MANRDITIDLNVDQQGAQRGLQKSNKQFKGYNKNVQTAEKRTSSFSGAMGKAAGAIGGLLAADQLISFAQDAAAAAVETQRWADRLGVTVEDLQELQFAAKQFGVSNDALIDGLKELSLRADEFAQVGSGPAAEAFERLGFNQAEINAAKDDTEALFRLVQERMSNVQSQAARQRIADELFGGQGGEQFTAMLRASGDEMAALRQEAQDTGAVVTEETTRRLEDLTTSMSQQWSKLVAGMQKALGEVAPVIVGTFELFENHGEAYADSLSGKVSDSANKMGIAHENAGEQSQRFWSDLLGFGDEAEEKTEKVSDNILTIGDDFTATNQDRDEFFTAYIEDLDTSNEKEENKKQNLQLISDEFNTNAENLDLLRQKQQQLSQLQNLPWSQQSVGQIRALKQEIDELQEKTTNWARDFQQAQQRDVQQVDDTEGAEQLGASQQDRQNAALRETVQVTNEVRQAQNAANSDIVKGRQQATRAEQMFQQSLGRGIAMQIQSADTAEDAANKIIDTIISQIVAYAIRSVFTSGISFPANIALAAGAAAAGKGLQSLIPEFAEGVTNFQGGNAIVGERGPEMVNLPRGSNVITNENVERMERQGTPGQNGNMRDAMVDALNEVEWESETRTEGDQIVQVTRKTLRKERKKGGRGTLS